MNFWEYKKVEHTPFLDFAGDVYTPTEENSNPVYLTGGDFDSTYWPRHTSWDTYLLLRSTRDGELAEQVKMYVYMPTDIEFKGLQVYEFRNFAVYSPKGESPCDPNFKSINHNDKPTGTLANYEALAYRFSKESSNE